MLVRSRIGTILIQARHIDDNHANLEEIEQEEAKNWFEEQVKKAKKFEPFKVLNQKLRGLEVFESNNDTPTPTPQPSSGQHSRVASPAPAPAAAPSVSSPDPDDIITRAHWQRPTGNDFCADPLCGKRLGSANGQINCRHCGKLFCEEHTMYQMKLSRSAQHEPVRGLWYRVCETCYVTREGYNDHNGRERNHFDYFKSTRRKVVDKEYLETSRLESRLTRLTQILADPPPPDPQQRSIWSTFTGNQDHMRALEQTVVPWEDDSAHKECPFCQQPFSNYGLRRHHCRTCGRVVCGDPETACSAAIGLNVDTKASEKSGAGKVAVDIRMCKDCQRTIFSKADFARELAASPPDQRAYQNLIQFEHGIRMLLPKFQRLLSTLQDPEKPPSPAQLAEASKVRKRLTDAFTQYNVASRRIRDLPTESPTQEKLQKAIYVQASNFLHTHMLPLKSLPKILKHATSNGKPSPAAANGHKPQSSLSSINYNHLASGSGSPTPSRSSSTSSVAITALEAEEKELREKLIVLEEQKFMVGEMIADANKRRKFDEVSALAQNSEDLTRDIDQIHARLAEMDFAGAYAGDGMVK